MAFFSKLLHFLKNFHPIRNFAKPVVRPKTSQTTTIAATFASVPLSYEALKEEVIETPHISELEITKTFAESMPAFVPELANMSEKEQEMEMHSDNSASTVVIRKLEVHPENSFGFNTPVVEEPLAPETVIGDIVDFSQFQSEPMPSSLAKEFEEMVAEVPAQAVETVTAEVDLVMAEVESLAEEVVATEETPAKKTRKHTAKAPAAKKPAKTTKAKTPSSTKATAGKAKKTTKATKVKKSRSTSSGQARKKNPTPQEAMGFGF